MKKRGLRVKNRKIVFAVVCVLLLILLCFAILFIGGKINGYNIFDGFVSLELRKDNSITGNSFADWVRNFFGGDDKNKERGWVMLGSPCSAGYADNVSQYNITWFFDDCYRVGNFVNGDWWVVGPVTIVNITPEYQYEIIIGNKDCSQQNLDNCTELSYTNLCFNKKCRYEKGLNGWVVNPSSRAITEGYDSRRFGFNFLYIKYNRFLIKG